MKKIYLLGAALGFLLVLSAYPQNNFTTVSEYRKTYSSLVEKWNTETNAIVRLELRQQIEKLKKNNLSLIVKK